MAARLEADSASRNDLADSLREEVDRLPEPLRTPVVLCYLEDMTYQGAARRLDVSVGTIRGRLVKARGMLRSRLGRTEEIAATGRADGPASRRRPPRVPAGPGRRDHPRRGRSPRAGRACRASRRPSPSSWKES